MSLLKNDLEAVYRNHHENKGRYGYLFCHGARGKYLAEWIGVGKKILDLGCRDGMLTSYYSQGNDVIGVDIDRKALEITRNTLSVETIWADLNTEWPFLPASFDVIVACEIMEHVFFLDHFLNQIKKTLKPGGLFLGSVPNSFRMRNRLKFLFGYPYENDPTHVRQFSFATLKNSLESRFQEVEIVPIQGKIFPYIPVSSKPNKINQLFAKDLLFKTRAL